MILQRRRAAAVLVVASSVLGLTSACTSDTARFCERLRDVSDLSELSDSILARDVRGINRSLDALREVEDVAPKEIFTDFRHLLDVLEDTVRTVTDVADASGSSTPVDPSTLTDQLTKIAEPAQKVSDYADEYCGITLTP